MDHIFKLHGLPVAIVPHRDRNFISKHWQDLFKSLKVSLHYNTTYHSQSDGQTERVNQCLENYVRCMTFMKPKKWSSWLALAEWLYNTNYHSSWKCSPFEALYGCCPPLLSEVMIPCPTSPALEFLSHKNDMIQKLKQNLAQAQARIKKYADNKRSERQFVAGDMVYLRLQPFRHAAFGIHQSLKLTTKFYGPFRILERAENVAHRLQLPTSTDIHPVFHASQLKKHLGAKAIPQSNLPLVTQEGYIKIEPAEVLDTRALPRNNDIVTQ
jgi:hypothetical protein